MAKPQRWTAKCCEAVRRRNCGAHRTWPRGYRTPPPRCTCVVDHAVDAGQSQARRWLPQRDLKLVTQPALIS